MFEVTTTKTNKQSRKKGIVRNPSGANQHVSVAGEGERQSRLSIRIPATLDEAIRERAEQEGTTLTNWIEEALKTKLQGVAGEVSPLLTEAIKLSLEMKKAAVSREKKLKRPNQALIAEWESQIKELEAMLV